MNLKKSENKPKLFRGPVVTIMGHVDHGKTTLLDYILKTRIVSKEHGGITQHVRSFQVFHDSKPITFIDTPGHEAFISMRERGTKLTDIIVLVVAADDGVMPQTREVISHWKKTNNHLIVAINKIDLPDINLDKIKSSLANEGVIIEGYGGDIPFVEISAKLGTNVDKLLELINIISELHDLDKFKDISNADYEGSFIVLEAFKDRFLGSTANIIVKAGNVKPGSFFIDSIGNKTKIRSIVDQQGNQLKEAVESQPVKITGLTELPNVGDEIKTYSSESLIPSIQNNNVSTQRGDISLSKSELAKLLFKKSEEEEIKTLNILLLADTLGSLEAIHHSLNKINVEGTRLNISVSRTGPVTLSDVETAINQNGLIISFNVQNHNNVLKEAERNSILVGQYNVIYELIEEIEGALIGLIQPDFEEEIIGFAEVLQPFQLSNGKYVAGCRVAKDKIVKGYQAYLERKNKRLYQGKITSLKHLKDDVKEVTMGVECGIVIDDSDFTPETGDLIVCFKTKKS